MTTFVLILLIIALVAVFSIQNAAPVAISFLFWKFEASLAIVIFLLLITGALLGVIVTSVLYSRSSGRKQPPPEAPENTDDMFTR